MPMPKESVKRPAVSFVGREMFPPSHREWLDAQGDGVAQIEEAFAKWLQAVSKFEAIAERKVYNNSECEETDLRFHRGGLAALISDGERIAIEESVFLAQGMIDADHFKAHVGVIDQHLAKLTKRLHEWHGALEDQADVPQSFKDGVNVGTHALYR